MNNLSKLGVVAGAVALGALVVAAFLAPPDSAQWVSATAATFSALAAVVTASVSAAALVQVRQDSRSSSRPMVAAWFRPGGAHGYIDLVVCNLGASVAQDLQVRLDELPHWTVDDPVLRDLVRRYQQPISVLVPNLELSNVYTSPDEVPAPKPPDDITVHVAYSDDQGRPYSDAFTLDAKVIKTGTIVEQRTRQRAR